MATFWASESMDIPPLCSWHGAGPSFRAPVCRTAGMLSAAVYTGVFGRRSEVRRGSYSYERGGPLAGVRGRVRHEIGSGHAVSAYDDDALTGEGVAWNLLPHTRHIVWVGIYAVCGGAGVSLEGCATAATRNISRRALALPPSLPSASVSVSVCHALRECRPAPRLSIISPAPVLPCPCSPPSCSPLLPAP